jgi:hypothetical protein
MIKMTLGCVVALEILAAQQKISSVPAIQRQ